MLRAGLRGAQLAAATIVLRGQLAVVCMEIADAREPIDPEPEATAGAAEPPVSRRSPASAWA
jgi:hypothetical protein